MGKHETIVASDEAAEIAVSRHQLLEQELSQATSDAYAQPAETPRGIWSGYIGGPEQGNERFWWQVRLEDDSEGWAAAEFLEPAAAPNN